jgi:hypothetical protein
MFDVSFSVDVMKLFCISACGYRLTVGLTPISTLFLVPPVILISLFGCVTSLLAVYYMLCL